MDCIKIGAFIAARRKERELTQQQLADALHISNKTVSKWECGQGCPDSALWPALSALLGVDLRQMLDGKILKNSPDTGNIRRLRFYVCPSCHNIITSTGTTQIICCGSPLQPLKPQKESDDTTVQMEVVDVDQVFTIDHPMTREHHVLFGATVKDDRVFLCRLYPEQDPIVRLPHRGGGTFYWYCTTHGLMAVPIKGKKPNRERKLPGHLTRT